MCTYLAKRGSIYYFRRTIPAELRPAMGGKTEFMITLATKDRVEAKRLIPAHTEATQRRLDRAAAQLAACTVPSSTVSRVRRTHSGGGDRSLQPDEIEAMELAEDANRAQDERREARQHLRD